MPGVRAECEVEQRVDHGGRVHRPLHHRDVGLAQRQRQREVQRQQRARLPVAQHVNNVEQLERGAGGFVDEDEEECDKREPEVWGAETAGAAASGLDQEGEPGDDQEDDREQEGQQEGGQVEVDGGGGPPVGDGVHTDRGVHRPVSNLILVWVVGPGADVAEERGGGGEDGGEDPDERDVDGVGPGSRHVLALGPLGVLNKQVVGQEEDGKREEEEEAVVEIPAKTHMKVAIISTTFQVSSLISKLSWAAKRFHPLILMSQCSNI